MIMIMIMMMIMMIIIIIIIIITIIMITLFKCRYQGSSYPLSKDIVTLFWTIF